MFLRLLTPRCAVAIAPVIAAFVLAACTYEREGAPALHFEHFETKAPKDRTVAVCSAYGCQHQSVFTFTESDILHVAAVMAPSRIEDTPEAERKAIGQAIAWIERRVGAETGTDTDRPGLDLFGSGDRSQQDCVDEATNTTSYMLVMERHGLLRHHVVARPIAKGNMILGRWPHWGAIVREKASGRRYAVDSFFDKNGEPPLILAVKRWYIDEGGPDEVERGPIYAQTPPPGTGQTDRSRLNRLVEGVLGPQPAPRPAAFGNPSGIR